MIPHKPVLLKEVLENLASKDGETYLDGTFGAGGYSQAILESANCNLYAIDRDETAKKFAAKLEKKFPDRFVFLSGKFSDSENLLAEKNITKQLLFKPAFSEELEDGSKHRSEGVLNINRASSIEPTEQLPLKVGFKKKFDGMVFDIGVSSMQLDDKSRGFSFDSDAKLDMRMDQTNPLSAYEVVNESSEEELAKIIKEFGEEPKARKIAEKIVKTRSVKPITSCLDLANIVRSFYFGYSKTDPATRTFQALRIFVNQELEELRLALASSLTLLKKGGRLIVVSFHSLEDQIVKNFLKKEAGLDQTFSRYAIQDHQQESVKNFHLLTKSAISPSKEEVVANPRARSARMRVAIRI